MGRVGRGWMVTTRDEEGGEGVDGDGERMDGVRRAGRVGGEGMDYDE